MLVPTEGIDFVKLICISLETLNCEKSGLVQ
jgi:hypothetical protein